MDDQQKPKSTDSYIPTPEQIAAECAKIRAEWTEAERHKRQARMLDDSK